MRPTYDPIQGECHGRFGYGQGLFEQDPFCHSCLYAGGCWAETRGKVADTFVKASVRPPIVTLEDAYYYRQHSMDPVINLVLANIRKGVEDGHAR